MLTPYQISLFLSADRPSTVHR